MSDALVPTYARLPVRFERGAGAWLQDADGRNYLDALSGIAVCNLGHAHPEVARAIAAQAETLVHTSNLYRVGLQEELAVDLCGLAGMEQAFFCNSGAEANETAIKLARRFGHQRGVERPTVAVMEGGFHGRTLGALAATGNPRAQEGFAPLPEGFRRIPFGDVQALEALADDPSVVAVLLEPIQGEGGVVVPPAGYLGDARRACDRHGWLLMLDEIQTGMGRTGRAFAFQHEDIAPDVVTLAKALGNGVPMGACLVRGAARGVLGPGSHGTTFGGNPLAAAAARKVVEILQRERLPERARALGQHLRERLTRELREVPGIREIRGRGLMIGIELDRPAPELPARALEQGLLINVTAESVVRLLPPLVLSDDDAERLVSSLGALLRAHQTEDSADHRGPGAPPAG